MAEAPLAVASAVILPDADASPPPSLKRRHSSISENDSKRRRVSHDEASIRQSPTSIPPPKADGRDGKLEGGQATEERKRGRRLFGALLGTLSQSSSSSTAHKRRSDIEKKQQAKLKLQTEEADERKKEKLEQLMKARRREQRVYDRQSMKIRHLNSLAQAHFLRTTAEPKLFYKPWKLTRDVEDTINEQVKEAEEAIEREAANWDVDNPSLEEEPEDEDTATNVKKEESTKMDTVGDENDKQDPSRPDNLPSANGNLSSNTNEHTKSEVSEAPKDHGAEGEEMVEGEEDTVIY